MTDNAQPTTEAGRALLRSDFDTTGWGPRLVREHVTRAILAIEAEVRADLDRALDADAPAEPQPCETCGGAGWVQETTADPLPSGEPGEPYPVQATCSDCGGDNAQPTTEARCPVQCEGREGHPGHHQTYDYADIRLVARAESEAKVRALTEAARAVIGAWDDKWIGCAEMAEPVESLRAAPAPSEPGLDVAYRERNAVAAALIRVGGYRAWRMLAPDAEGWWIVYAETPEGQVSWHVSATDIRLFDDVPVGTDPWDGHTTDEKYERVARLRGGQE